MTINESDALQDSPQQTARGVGVLANLCSLVAMLGSWWAFSAPRGLEILLILLGFLLLWSVILLLWLSRLVSYIRSSAGRSEKTPLAARLSWCVAPVLCAVTIVSVYLGLPLRVRFEASRAAMNSVVDDRRKGVPFNGPRWVGWYYVTEVANMEGEINQSIYVLLKPDLGFRHYAGTEGYPYGGTPLGGEWYTYAQFPT
jgi:hypothetical protein